MLKKLNWMEADQLAIYKQERGVETRDYRVTSPTSGHVGIVSTETGAASVGN